MRLYNMIGYKLFKEKEDGTIHMIRIVGMKKPFKITSTTKDPSEITIYDYDTNERKKVRVDSLKDYSPLEPDGIAVFNIVNIRDEKGNLCKDVVVTASKFLNVKMGLSSIPYAVCRQNITDIFYNLMAANEEDTLVGLSVNQDTCPANFKYQIMFAADSIIYSDFINFYRIDTLDDICSMVKVMKFNDVLNDLFTRHINHINRPELVFKSEHGGWCKDLKTLLTENNFMSDINQMLGVTQVEFKIDDYLDTVTRSVEGSDNIKYQVANVEFATWLSLTFKINIKEAAVLEFGHDINLGDFNDNKYLLFRDSENKLYLIVYTEDGEFFEKDLEDKAKELDFSTKFKMSFEMSKYADID